MIQCWLKWARLPDPAFTWRCEVPEIYIASHNLLTVKGVCLLLELAHALYAYFLNLHMHIAHRLGRRINVKCRKLIGQFDEEAAIQLKATTHYH